MSRFFVQPSSEYLETDQAVVSGPPFTAACFFRSNDLVSNQTLISLADKDVGDQSHRLLINRSVGGDPVRLQSAAGAGNVADTSIGYSANTWHHAGGIWAADNDRAVFLDGTHKGVNAVNRAPAGIDRTSIGRVGDSTPGQYMNGDIAEVSIWDAALTDYEIYLHSIGVPAPFIRPQNLVAYWPLRDGVDFEWMRRFDMTAYNTPGVGEHPPKVLEYWNKLRMRAVSTQGTMPLASWGVPNVWSAKARAPSFAPILTTYSGYSVPVGA